MWRLPCGCVVLTTDDEGRVFALATRRCPWTEQLHIGEIVRDAIEARAEVEQLRQENERLRLERREAIGLALWVALAVAQEPPAKGDDR